MTDPKVIEQIVNAIREIIEPDKIILFGSRARGDARPDSDYDILIIKNEIPNYFEILKKLYRKMLEVDQKVDFILKTSEDIEKSKKRVLSVSKDALKEGIVIYG